MTNKSPIFKFVSLRNPIIDESNQSLEEVTVSSPLVISLTKISNSSDESTVQLTNYNTELQTYIDSPQYIKTQADLDALAAEISDSPTEEFLNQLYDNILVKSLVKGNTNAIYKKLVDLFKSLYATLNSGQEIEIVIPQNVLPNFVTILEDETISEDDSVEQLNLYYQLRELLKIQARLVEAR